MREAAVSPYLFFLLKTAKWEKNQPTPGEGAQHRSTLAEPENLLSPLPPPLPKPNYIFPSTRQLRGDFEPISLFCLGLKWTFHLNPLSSLGPFQSDSTATTTTTTTTPQKIGGSGRIKECGVGVEMFGKGSREDGQVERRSFKGNGGGPHHLHLSQINRKQSRIRLFPHAAPISFLWAAAHRHTPPSHLLYPGNKILLQAGSGPVWARDGGTREGREPPGPGPGAAAGGCRARGRGQNKATGAAAG